MRLEQSKSLELEIIKELTKLRLGRPRVGVKVRVTPGKEPWVGIKVTFRDVIYVSDLCVTDKFEATNDWC